MEENPELELILQNGNVEKFEEIKLFHLSHSNINEGILFSINI